MGADYPLSARLRPTMPSPTRPVTRSGGTGRATLPPNPIGSASPPSAWSENG